MRIKKSNTTNRWSPPVRYIKRRKRFAPVGVRGISAPEHAKLAKKGIVYGEVNWGPEPDEHADDF